VTYEIKQGDALSVLRSMPDESVQMCVTSPPYYGLRDYGVEGQIGLEDTPQAFVAALVAVFEEVRRVLKKDGTCWVNLGDSYAGYWGDKNATQEGRRSSADTNGWTNGFHMNARPSFHEAFDGTAIKPKDLMGMPWRVAFALQEAGWWLRQDIIWSKPNPMPESVTDRCTKAHEYIFLLSKSPRYYYDQEAIKEKSTTQDTRRPYGSQGAWAMDGRPDEQRHGGEQRSWKGSQFHAGKTAIHQLERSSKNRDRTVGNRNGEGASTLDVFDAPDRNKRSVWTVSTRPYAEAHFATFPEKLIEPCILAGSREGDTVLDPFSGAGTSGLVSLKHRRNYLGIELNPAYIEISEKRLRDVQVQLF
jgi:DNA modification methylase